MKFLYVCGTCLETNFQFTPAPGLTQIPISVRDFCKTCNATTGHWNAAEDRVIQKILSLSSEQEQSLGDIDA